MHKHSNMFPLFFFPLKCPTCAEEADQRGWSRQSLTLSWLRAALAGTEAGCVRQWEGSVPGACAVRLILYFGLQVLSPFPAGKHKKTEGMLTLFLSALDFSSVSLPPPSLPPSVFPTLTLTPGMCERICLHAWMVTFFLWITRFSSNAVFFFSRKKILYFYESMWRPVRIFNRLSERIAFPLTLLNLYSKRFDHDHDHTSCPPLTATDIYYNYASSPQVKCWQTAWIVRKDHWGQRVCCNRNYPHITSTLPDRRDSLKCQ